MRSAQVAGGPERFRTDGVMSVSSRQRALHHGARGVMNGRIHTNAKKTPMTHQPFIRSHGYDPREVHADDGVRAERLRYRPCEGCGGSPDIHNTNRGRDFIGHAYR